MAELADLPIPDAAVAALYDLADDVAGDTDSLRADVRVIAAPVVAAELRRIATGLLDPAAAPHGVTASWSGVQAVAESLLRRADVLAPSADSGEADDA